MQRIEEHIIAFFKDIYSVWFPWLDIAILAYIYIFLWGEHITPYREYHLIKHGEVAVGKISGEGGLYQYSESPRMRDFEYTFTLPTGKIIKSSAHTFTLDKKNWKRPSYPVIADILYLPNNPEINWIKSDLSATLGDFFYRNLVFGTSFIIFVYMIATIVIRLSILQEREQKQTRKFAKEGRILIKLPIQQLN